MKKRIAFIYHNADTDGKSCCALLKLISHNISDNIDVFGYNYGTNPEEDIWLYIENNKYDLYIFADITPPISFVKKIDETQKINIYDHHIDRLNEIKELENSVVNIHFEEGMSGTGILYHNMKSNKFIDDNIELKNFMINDFFKSTQINLNEFDYLMKIINDYDTYKFDNENYKNPNQKHDCLLINEFIMYLNDVDEIERFFKSILFDYPYRNIKDWRNIATVLENQLIKSVDKNIDSGIDVLYHGNKGLIFQGYPNYYFRDKLKSLGYDFYIGINIDIKKTILFKCSIRSLSDNFNCLNIAKYYGGGGHPGAAGFRMPMNTFDEFILIHKINK